MVAPDVTPKVVGVDPDDDHFLAAAVAGKVDCIVCGDPRVLTLGNYQGIAILTPAEFLATYFPE